MAVIKGFNTHMQINFEYWLILEIWIILLKFFISFLSSHHDSVALQ